MSEIRSKSDFINRTKDILELEFKHMAEQDREVTFLLNCLLGTIVAVLESEEGKKQLKGNVDGEFITLLPDEIGFIKKPLEQDSLINVTTGSIKFEVGNKADIKSVPKSWLLKKIRNGIAHLNIEWKNEGGQCKAIRLWNEPKPQIRDFEIVFTVEELREFAVRLSCLM